MKKINLLFSVLFLMFLVVSCGADDAITSDVYQLDTPVIDCGDIANCKGE